MLRGTEDGGNVFTAVNAKGPDKVESDKRPRPERVLDQVIKKSEPKKTR